MVHDNPDVAGIAIKTILELLDEETLKVSANMKIVDILHKTKCLSLLDQCCSKLNMDEKEDH